MKHLLILFIIFYPLYLYVNHAAKKHAATIAAITRLNPYGMIEEGQSRLMEGDLVVRMNRDPSSRFIKYFNHKDKNYSHSGIVLFEHEYPYVYHIIDGEENPDQKMRKDSLSHFCNPRKNAAYGIYRYDLSVAEIYKLKEIIHGWYAKGLRFDSAFSLATDDKMYCSEMISKALTEATGKRISIEQTQLTMVEASFLTAYTHLPISYTNRLPIIPIDALYVNPYCRLIKKYAY
jgi:Permuted papain-like amidase enzyme, YaeF/YiiX, C92 family